MLMFLIMRNGGGFRRSFRAALLMPRRLVPSGVTGGSFFCSLSLVVSKLCCTFATELRTLAALAVNSVSPERACGALKSLCFSIFFNSVLSGQDVGESARGAARWAAPFFASGEFSISSNTLFPMTAVRSYRCRNIYQVSLLEYKEHLVFYIKSDVFYIIFDVF